MLGISVNIMLALLEFQKIRTSSELISRRSNVSFSRALKSFSDPKTYDSRNLKPSAQVLARSANLIEQMRLAFARRRCDEP